MLKIMLVSAVFLIAVVLVCCTFMRITRLDEKKNKKK